MKTTTGVPLADAPSNAAPALLTVEDHGPWLTERPPNRDYLLTGEIENAEVGILPQGKVAMIAAAGGQGKSWLAILLALAVSLGREWIGFRCPRPGRVLLLLGEEDVGEVWRRLYYGAEALRLSEFERAKAAQMIYPLALAGCDCALTTDGTIDEPPAGRERDRAAGLPVTPFFGELLDRLDRGGPWKAIAADPISRFAGAEVEIDNAQATRYIQANERLTAVAGNPTLVLFHHTSKATRRDGQPIANDAAAASSARGSSALTDGVRWQANLESLKRTAGAPELAVLRVVKSNYARLPPDRVLVRDPALYGALRVATGDDMDAAEQAKSTESDTARQRKQADLESRQ